MIVVLSFLLGILLLLGIGIYFSKIKIKVKNIEFAVLDGKADKNNKYISIGIYLYSILKIFEIKCRNDGIYIFGIKISYRRIRQTKAYKDIVSQDIRDIKIDKKLLLKEINELGISLNKLDLTLELGTTDTIITSFLIFLIATILSFAVKKSVKKYNDDKHKFTVTPIYRECNFINLNLQCVLSAKLVKLIKLVISLNTQSTNKTQKENILPSGKLDHIPN